MRKRHGLKIKNFEAAVLFECQNGIRSHLDYTPAMFTNSLLQDYLLENGMEIYKERATRDIICVEFNFGAASYEETVKKLQKNLNQSEDAERKAFFENLIQRAHSNKDKYLKISSDDLRRLFYKEGIEIQYDPKTRIKYKMFYRTPGKAKEGSCMFINEKLYERAINFIRMGLEMPEDKAQIIEMGAYSSLVASTIIDRIRIDPDEILVIKDIESISKVPVISVETDENRHCIARRIEDYPQSNILFDGQALIEESIFPDWADGYILLRHHMTKCAAFSAGIQRFFRDKLGADYESALLKDMWGRDIPASKVKLITTENALKWLKFGVDFDYWAAKVRENDCLFGIVKTAHESKIGNVQRMSYQMVNALSLSSMKETTETSRKYIELLKNDDEFFRDFLRKNGNYCNDFEVLDALIQYNPNFARTDYFRERRQHIIDGYAKGFKTGRLLQEGDNLVIVGNPYGMLMASIGEDALQDPTFTTESGAIQCYTGRFEDGEYLASFRSPFNSQNNMGHLHNVYSELLTKYCNIGRQCIAINMVGTDFQNRNNGSDQDSDSIYVTNQPEIVSHARFCVENYPTIANNIPKSSKTYRNVPEDFALVDNTLQAANSAIGLSSNLAQLCLTYTYNFNDQKYLDNCCILSVLA